MDADNLQQFRNCSKQLNSSGRLVTLCLSKIAFPVGDEFKMRKVRAGPGEGGRSDAVVGFSPTDTVID